MITRHPTEKNSVTMVFQMTRPVSRFRLFALWAAVCGRIGPGGCGDLCMQQISSLPVSDGTFMSPRRSVKYSQIIAQCSNGHAYSPIDTDSVHCYTKPNFTAAIRQQRRVAAVDDQDEPVRHVLVFREPVFGAIRSQPCRNLRLGRRRGLGHGRWYRYRRSSGRPFQGGKQGGNASSTRPALGRVFCCFDAVERLYRTE